MLAPASLSTLFTKHGYLLFLLPTMFVYFLASIIFEISFTKDVLKLPSTVGAHIASQDTSELPFKLLELKARYIWFTTTVVAFVVHLYTAIICGTIIYRSHSGKRLLIMKVIGIGLIGAGIGGLIYSAITRNAMFQLIYHFSFHTLQDTNIYQIEFLHSVDTLLAILNVLAVIVTSMVLLAAVSTVAPALDQTHNPRTFLSMQMRHLKGVLNAGSALLVVGILNMSAWLRWPVGLLTDSTEQAALSGAVTSITMFWGATFTLMLITTYGPAASYLSSQARAFAEEAQQSGTIEDAERWLHDNHFSITLGEQLPQISVILGPVLAGPIGSFLMSHMSA